MCERERVCVRERECVCERESVCKRERECVCVCVRERESVSQDQSRLQCYLKLNREYSLADYLVSVRNITHRHLLTKYRLSDHQLAIERGRHKKTWFPKEERICNECRSGSVETEEHFLLHCDKYTSLRDALYSQIQQIIPEFQSLQEHEKICFGSTSYL